MFVSKVITGQRIYSEIIPLVIGIAWQLVFWRKHGYWYAAASLSFWTGESWQVGE